MGRPSNARQRLIEAANEVVYAHSYEAATIDALCAAANVTKSSFYHFFSSKQDLVLTALEHQWQWFQQTILTPAFSNHHPPQEQMLHFFDLVLEQQQMQRQTSGHLLGCPVGNLTLEMSSQDEAIRARLEQCFQEFQRFFERVLSKAKAQGIVPATLDTRVTAQALLAYYEGALLLAKGQNDPTVLATLRAGALALMQCHTL